MSNKQDARTYRSWAAMKTKCNNQHSIAYKYGGALGVSVCPQWNSYTGFLRDMGEAPDGLHLDRIDRDGDFEPGNCIWATKSQINFGRKNITTIEHQGKTLTISQWSLKLFGNRTTLRSRLAQGWNQEEALSKPFGAKQEAPRKERVCKPVYQYTDEWVFVAEHNGLVGAGKAMGVTIASIRSAILMRHKSKGFRWSYDKR